MAVLLYEVVADKISILTWIAVALFAIEVVVLIANNWTCPLTICAENLESYRGQTTDIFFLPKWFGDPPQWQRFAIVCSYSMVAC
jgi:hypothetical protein